MTLETYLFENAAKCPGKLALVSSSGNLTYQQLASQVKLRADSLINLGIKSGDLLVVRSSQTIDYIVLYFACHLVEATICPLEKDLSEEKIDSIANVLNANWVSVDLNIFKRLSFNQIDSCKGIADILFTTGTTGNPKGVMISQNAILANGDNLVKSQGFHSDLVFVITGPLNHSGNWSKVIPTMMVGATLYILEGMKDLNAFFNAFEFTLPKFTEQSNSIDNWYDEQKYACFLVPASIRMLLLLAKARLQSISHKIEFVETGAAPISSSDMKSLSEVLPNSRLYNTYASSETGMVSTYNFNDHKYKSGCVGNCMVNASAEILDYNSNSANPSNSKIGIITCTNGGQMSGYFNAPELTSSVLKNGIVYTKDLGYIDEDGMLVIVGRDDDVINVGGLKVSPVEVENMALSYSQIADCICIPQKHPIMGNVLKLLFVPKDNDTLDKRSIAKYLSSKLEAYKVPTLYEQVEKINRTYNGKLDRKSYIS